MHCTLLWIFRTCSLSLSYSLPILAAVKKTLVNCSVLPAKSWGSHRIIHYTVSESGSRFCTPSEISLVLLRLNPLPALDELEGYPKVKTTTTTIRQSNSGPHCLTGLTSTVEASVATVARSEHLELWLPVVKRCCSLFAFKRLRVAGQLAPIIQFTTTTSTVYDSALRQAGGYIDWIVGIDLVLVSCAKVQEEWIVESVSTWKRTRSKSRS